MKHAFLIMVHHEPVILDCLLKQLCHPDNKIFVHIDKKVSRELENDIVKVVNKWGGVIVNKRIDVRWGDYSLIECELTLFKEALKSECDYYHLLSGSDLLLKPMAQFHDFFERHKGKEFIRFCYSPSDCEDAYWKTNYYHFFMKYCTKRTSGWLTTFCKRFKLPQISIRMQRLLHISRVKSTSLKVLKGDEWCSLSYNAVSYIIGNAPFIKKRFKWTCAADEIYKQSLINASPFMKNIYSPEIDNLNAGLRLIDWRRGTPYVWKYSDIKELTETNNFFARKFSSEDMQLITYIVQNTVKIA